MHPDSETFVGPNPERLRRLRYVTENFNNLQGLRMAALGVGFLAFRISDVAQHTWLSFLMSAVGIAVGVMAFRRLPDYYERRFGQVEPPSKWKPMTRREAIGCLGILAGVLLFAVFSGPLGRFFSYIWTATNDRLNAMLAVTDHRLNFLPIFYWFVMLVMSIPFRHIDRVDLRRTSLWLGGTLVWSVVVLLPVHHPDLVNLSWWKVLNDSWLFISFIIIGLYEHFTLVWLLSRTAEVEQ